MSMQKLALQKRMQTFLMRNVCHQLIAKLMRRKKLTMKMMMMSRSKPTHLSRQVANAFKSN